MAEAHLPFFVAGLRVGMVSGVEHRSGFTRGQLQFDASTDPTVISIFHAVVGLAEAVERSSPQDYRRNWRIWDEGCGELQDLNLWIGNADGPIESFRIKSDWTIEWTSMPRDTTLD